MQVESMLFANADEIREGLLYVLGGGWAYVEARELPWPIAGWVFGTMRFDPEELGVGT